MPHQQYDFINQTLARAGIGFIKQKIQDLMIKIAYSHAYVSLQTSVLSATVIYALLQNRMENHYLAPWYLLFLVVTLVRIQIIKMQKYYFTDQSVLWKKIFIFSAVLGGLSWVFLEVFVFDAASDSQKMMIVLVVNSIAVGGAISLAAELLASYAFLSLLMLPLVLKTSFSHYYDLVPMLNGLLLLLWVYGLFIAKKSHDTIKQILELECENQLLFAEVSHAKTQLEESNLKLSKAATHDPLTKTANRSLFYNNLEKAIDIANADKSKFALFYLDIDKFKSINDTFGHETGDFILQEFTRRLKKTLRKTDKVARLGGDEFAIILSGFSAVDDVIKVAEYICVSVRKPVNWERGVMNISASIGVSIYPQDGITAKELIVASDKAMYYAKRNGRDRYQLFHLMNDISV